MKNSNMLGLGINLHEILDIHSNLAISGIENIKRSVGITESLQKYCQNSINNLSAQVFRNFQNSYQDSISNIARGLQNIQKVQIEQLGSAMRDWQSSMELMSNDFLKNYNNMIKNSAQDLISGISTLNYSNLDFSSLRALRVNELTVGWDKVEEAEVEYGLENKIDLQEVEAIVNAKIEDIKLATKEQNGDIVFAINKLTEAVVEGNAKESIKDNVVSSVIAEIILKLLFWLMPLMISFANPNTSVTTNNNYIVKTIKKEIRVMDFNNDFYNNFRIVSKDGLEVRRSNKMKSGIKYYLDFGNLVKMEHKNKNWTKISYTNALTDEREIGWVLTRYIKRLD